jgi:glycosyltransferase involved in cell wall biosynthesis/GT2 family glycosyltransferase
VAAHPSESNPRVSVLVAVSNGERYLRPALESVLRQTVADFELLVVDDGSTDSTPSVLSALDDPRLRVLRNEARHGLAGALNRGLDEARGRYVARMDADDIALPRWLERVLARIESGPPVALVGAGVLEFDDRGRVGAVHLPEPTPAVTRWYSHFSSSPFFHNTVVFDHGLFEREHLRYDESFGESEDFELWTRVLEHGEADCLPEALVLYRRHPEQASKRRTELQRELGRQVALGQIARTAPSLGEAGVELAWRFGFRLDLEEEQLAPALDAYLELLRSFSGSGRYTHAELAGVRQAAARAIARRAPAATGATRGRLAREALALDPALALHAARRRARHEAARRRGRGEAATLLRAEGGPIRVAAVFPEPTPYRAPLLDRVAAREEVELTVIYAAPSVVAGREWDIGHEHDAHYLGGFRLPGGARVFRHDYPITPAIAAELGRARPDVVVVSGWSTFAAQAAIVWCRLRRIPYVLLVESHDAGPRPGWRRTVKGGVVPPIARGAAATLVTGTLARGSMEERGAQPERIHVFANTVDVAAFGERADALAARRLELRQELAAGRDDVLVVSVSRLSREKSLDVLIRGLVDAGDERLVLALVGDGPERADLEALARELSARVVFAGERPWERIVEAYVAGDVFALVSERETWAVVVNEASACGLPLVLSDRVGAAHDLLRDGENGFLVAAGDVAAIARALRRLAADPEERRRLGARSRELAQGWGYEPSVEGFLAAVREAAGQTEKEPEK